MDMELWVESKKTGNMVNLYEYFSLTRDFLSYARSSSKLVDFTSLQDLDSGHWEVAGVYHGERT